MIGTSLARAQLAADVEAGAVGEHQVEQDEVGLQLAPAASIASAAVPATRGANPSRSSAAASGSDDRRLVLDQEDPPSRPPPPP